MKKDVEYINLGTSNLVVSRLCMGGCPMGGHGWGEDISEKELISSVHKALDIGINFFDTADVYGLGTSEETLGKALSNRRNRAVIATKFGVRYENGRSSYDNSPEWIRFSIDNSLRRLKTDYVDLYQIHYRDNTPLEDVLEQLSRLQESGKIRFIGISNLKTISEIRGFEENFVSIQNEYSLANRSQEKILKILYHQYTISPLTWGSLGQGILTGKYDKNTKFKENDRRSRASYTNFHGDKLLKNLEIVEELKRLAVTYSKPVSAIAIRWILDYLENSIVLVGIKHPQQIVDNSKALGWTLNGEDLLLLDKKSN